MSSVSRPEQLQLDPFAKATPGLGGFFWVFAGIAGLLGSVVGLLLSSFFSGPVAWAVGLGAVVCALVVGFWRGVVFYRQAVAVWVRELDLKPAEPFLSSFELESLIRAGLPRPAWGELSAPLPRLWVYASGGPAVFAFREAGGGVPQIALSQGALTALSGSELRQLLLDALLLSLRPETPRYTATAALALRLSRWVGEGWAAAALGGETLGRVSPEGFLKFLVVYPALLLLVRRPSRVGIRSGSGNSWSLGNGPGGPLSHQRLAGAARLQPSGRHWAMSALSLVPLGPEKIVLSP